MSKEEIFTPRRLQLEEFNQLSVVVYSVSQNASEVRTVNEMLENNRRNVFREIPSDYVPIAVTYTTEEAYELAEKFRQSIDERNAKRTVYEADTTQGDKERLELLEFSEDRLWTHFRMSDS